MKRVDVYFLLLATLLLVCGAILGIVMGAREDFQLVPVHAHLNLAGWASLALFGLTYRAYPELASTKVAGFHFIVSGTASGTAPNRHRTRRPPRPTGSRDLRIDPVASGRSDVPSAAGSAARRERIAGRRAGGMISRAGCSAAGARRPPGKCVDRDRGGTATFYRRSCRVRAGRRPTSGLGYCPSCRVH